MLKILKKTNPGNKGGKARAILLSTVHIFIYIISEQYFTDKEMEDFIGEISVLVTLLVMTTDSRW